MRRPLLEGASWAGWALFIALAAFAWYLTGRGLAFRLGLGDAASGVGSVVALLVAVTLVRWSRGDAESDALASLRCPACGLPVETRHEHASGTMPGRQLWSCAACGFATIAPLTCEGCAA
ncbi:MAG: hypothetical protein U0360_11355 [Dehalococcoidia bacterium]